MSTTNVITRLTIAIVVLCALLVGLALQLGSEMPDAGIIMFDFSFNAAIDRTIYLVDVDSGTLHNLTLHQKVDGSPVLSPRGGQLAFVSTFTDGAEISLTELFTGVTQHLENTDDAYTVAWSPDGRRIAYNANGEIYVVDIETGVVRNLTDHPATDWYPVWSPDNQQIVFMSERDTGQWQIYTVEVDSRHIQRLTYTEFPCTFPAWSPDGQQIVFELYTNIAVMDADGSNLRQLTDTNYPDAGSWGPSWSPDGDAIIFTSQFGNPPDPIREVYSVNIETGIIRPLTDNPALDGSPMWSPDGRQIAFLSSTDSGAGVYVMESDGRHPRRLVYSNTRVINTLAWWPSTNPYVLSLQ